jgi:Tfp pilus assembly PilM family ATPase
MPRLVAIDLGSHAVKVSVLNGSARRYQLEDRFLQPVPQDGSTVPSLEARLSALDVMLDDHKEWASGNTVFAVGFPGEQATFHRLHLPFTDKAQVEQTLPFTIEEHVPFDLEEMALGWRQLDSVDGTDTLVGLVKKDALRGLIEGLGERSLEPRHVFLDGDVLAAWAPRDKVVAVVDIGHTHAVAAVVRDGVVHWCRTINVGGRDFTKAIQRATATTWDEAERWKHGDGSASPEQVWMALPPQAREAMDAPIGLLLAEVRSTLIAAEDALGAEIEELLVSGGGARLHPLVDFLHDDLRVPVRWLSADDAPIPPEHAVADGIGARLAGQTRGVEIDFRTGEFAYRGGIDVVRGVLMFGVPLVAFCMMTSIVLTFWQYHRLSNEQAAAEAELKNVYAVVLPDVAPQQLTSTDTTRSLLQGKLDDAKARARALDRSDAVPPTVDKLLALTNAFPPPTEVSVDVSELTITPENITFTAETDGYTSSAAVEEALQKVDRFSQAEKANEKKVKERVQFSVTIPLGANTTDGAAPGEEG